MGIWKQRIDESWLKCSGESSFKIINVKGGTGETSGNAIAISLKHSKIDSTTVSIKKFLPSTNTTYPVTQLDGFMSSNIGLNTILGTGVYSYILDYYFGPSINSRKKFSAKKNYQFKTHVYNFAYANNRSVVESYLNNDTNNQPNGRLYNSTLNIFKGALGINPTWEDSYYFDVPYYMNFDRTKSTQTTMYILYYYSSPVADTRSGFVAFTNKLKSSKLSVSSTDVELDKSSTQSVYQAGYGIGGMEINEIGWKIQGYSFASYDNDPNIGDYTQTQVLTNIYSGELLINTSGKSLPNKLPLKRCYFGKGWYYDSENNEYTWYDQKFETIEDSKNNPVGGATGFQESHEGYRENNYIAKYIPFQKFNISFLYECLRTDSGIKIYLSPTLPSSKALGSIAYKGVLKFPDAYYIQGSTNYNNNINKGLSLVSNQYQYADGLPLGNNSGLLYATYSIPATISSTNPSKPNIYAPTTNGFEPTDASRSTVIKDYNGSDPNKALVNNIYVDDDNTNLKEIRVNITLRHTYLADMVINLRVPNGNVINLKAKYSGDFFNDLRNITFTTNTDSPKLQGLNLWPNTTNKGYVWDPIGLPAAGGFPATGPSYPVKAPWLPAPYNNFTESSSKYNFDWSQLRVISGLTFQMDKNNGLGTTTTLNGFNNILLNNTNEVVDFRSSVNDLKYLVNADGTFNGTYSLYIKDDWGGDSGMFEDWNIEFLYKKVYTPILTLTQSDVSNTTNPGAAKLQYLFGLEGNQYLFIVGDKVNTKADPNVIVKTTTGTASLLNLRASLKNLKIDGGYHDANNKMYRVNDAIYGENTSTNVGASASGDTNPTGTTASVGSGGDNTLSLINPILNVSYSAYVGYGNLNDPTTLSLSSVTGKIGNGKFISGIWENGAWNSGWRKDENLHEFYNISDFFSYNRDKRWRFSISSSLITVSKFEVGDKVSIGNIIAIDVNEERKLIKNYFTVMTKNSYSISVEFESDFPIRRIMIDSDIHRIYITKNVWLTGGFFNGYFTGVWNNGLFKGFPYITEMFDSHWLDGKFDGGHFQSKKRSIDFSNTYIATFDKIKIGIIFDGEHRLAVGDQITISSDFTNFGSTKILSVPDDYRIIVDLDWDSTKDPNTYGTPITGTITTNISTGLVQNIDFNSNNVSTITSLQSMDNTRVFMYNSWMDVNFDNTTAVNIGKPQSTIDNSVSTYSYSENNLYGYPTYDILSSSVTFRDSFSNTIRKYRLGSKYKVYEDYIGDAGDFGEYFDITGWATKTGLYKINTFPFTKQRPVLEQLPASTEFTNQGWVFAKDGNIGSAISFERTTEAVDDDDPATGKEMRVSAVKKGGVLNIQPSYEVSNRTNSPITRQRYTIIKFDLIQALIPDFIFEESSSIYDDSSKYQPLIHFNNLNYVLRKVYVPGIGYKERKMDTTYLPIYKNINHVSTFSKSKIEYFYNKTNLSMFFRGNGLDGSNVSTFVLDNMKLYEVDMIPFFQYFNTNNINKSVSVPYQATAPNIEYLENDYSLLDNSIYGLDSFNIYQPSGEVSIQAESAAAAAEAALQDPVISAAVDPTGLSRPRYGGYRPQNTTYTIYTGD
jgi:subtilisin-like proprotein convertase family protein